MTAPYPGLRRFYTLGGAARRAVERLGDEEEELLARLEPSVERLDLVRGQAIEPLLALADGSAAIERILQRLFVAGGAPAADLIAPETAGEAGEAGEKDEPDALSPELPRRLPDVRQQVARPAASRTVPPSPAGPARVAETLSLYDAKNSLVDRADGAPGTRSRGSGRVSPTWGRVLPRLGRTSPEPGKSPPERRESFSGAGEESPEPGQGLKPLADEAKPTPEGGGVGASSLRGGFFRGSQGSKSLGEELRARAARAGAENAADAPVRAGSPDPQIVRLLERFAPSGEARTAAEEPEPASGGTAALPPPVPRIGPTSRPVGSGLRALASLAGPASPAGSETAAPQPPDGATAARPPGRTASFLDAETGPPAAEGADASDLAARLDRLLRREARRHGIEMDEP